jgi:hypothetical protein
VSTAEPQRVALAPQPETSVVEEPAAPVAPDARTIFATAGVTAGTMISGGVAPTAGLRVAATTPPPWLRGGELGASVAIGRLWRGDDMHSATFAHLAATLRRRSSLGWARASLAGELGAAYISRLDSSSGVVPGLSRTGQWAPLVRGEIGAGHDVAHHLAVRVALGVGVLPRSGAMLASAGQVDLMIGLGYER